jgi:long-chain fatty acid transport protein
MTIEPTDRTTIGLAFRSEVEMKIRGTADITLGGNLTTTGLSSTVDLPASFSLSASHQVNKFTWLADVTWTGWSSFQELRVVYDNPADPDTKTTYNWNDTYRFSLGFDYQQSDKLVLRTGVAYDESPVPDAEHRTVRLPGNDRTWLSFGLTYLFNPNMSFDVGYSHLFVKDGPINNTLESETAQLNATVTGEYEASVDILSAQFNWYY